MARSCDGSLRSPGDDGRPSVFVHTRLHVCQAVFLAQTFLEGLEGYSLNKYSQWDPLVERELKGLQAAARQGAFRAPIPLYSRSTVAHSLTSGLNNMPERPGGPRWAGSVESLSRHSTRCKALSCQGLDMSLGFPLSPSFPLKQKGQTLECMSSCLPVYRKKNSW